MPAPGQHDRLLNDLLSDLVERLVSSGEDHVEVGLEPFGHAAEAGFSLLSKAGLLERSEPANELVCQGCERGCVMPVQVVRGPTETECRAFVVCDRRDDIGRVSVDPAHLDRWQFSFRALTDVLSTVLSTDCTASRMGNGRVWTLGRTQGDPSPIEVILCPTGNDIGISEALAVVLGDPSGAPERGWVPFSSLVIFEGHRLRVSPNCTSAALARRLDDTRVGAEIRYERGEIVFLNHLTGTQRTLAAPNFNSSNDNAFDVLYRNAGKSFSLDELRRAARTPNLGNLHKVVENLNFEGDLKRLFFRVSKNSISFDRTATVGQLRALGIDAGDLP